MNKASLKAHVDSHLIGITQGEVPPQWMRDKGWAVCPHCTKTAAANRMGGVHESCAARARVSLNSTRDEWSQLQDGHDEGGWASRLRRLPAFREIFEAMVYTRE